MCNACETFAEQHQGGAEVEMSLLFADVRDPVGTYRRWAGIESLGHSATTDRLNKTRLIQGSSCQPEQTTTYAQEKK